MSKNTKFIQISPRWNSIALEYISQRKNLPTIKHLQWEFGGQLTLHLQENCLRFMGIEKWECSPLPSSRNVSACNIYNISRSEIQILCAKSPELPKLICSGNGITDRIVRLFQRFARIERFEFFVGILYWDEHRALFNSAITNLPVGEVIVNGRGSLDIRSR